MNSTHTAAAFTSRPHPPEPPHQGASAGREPYPRLARLLAAGAAPAVAVDLERISNEPGADSIRSSMELARRIIEALDAGTLPPPLEAVSVPGMPFELTADVSVPAGLRPLIGETAYLMLEAGRLPEAGLLFAALGALAPDAAAAGVGLAAVHLLRKDVHLALSAASWAVSAEPSEPCGHATLAEVLLAAGRKDAARAVLMRSPPSSAAVGTWMRLLRRGMEDGWLEFGAGEMC